ncbi:MAG TPA: EamA family transporter [Candidatus Thermoplasmatota archaeon]
MRISAGFAFIACTFIWGTTWLAIKFGYGGLDAVWGASLRFLLAGIILLPIVLGMKIPLPKGRRQWSVAAFAGVAMFAIDYGLIYWGEQFLSSGLTAILFATMPLFVAIIAVIVIPSERMTPMHAAGIAIGLGGLFIIFFPDLRTGTSSIWPAVAIVLSAVAAAATSVVVRRWGRDLHPLSLNATAMLLGGSILALASLALGETPGLPSTQQAWLSLLYLVAFGSILSFILYWNLLRQWPAHRAGLIPIATPVVAVITGFVLNDEVLTLYQWLGSAIVILGVGVSLLPTASRAPAPTATAK